jgi:hypothetical protein
MVSFTPWPFYPKEKDTDIRRIGCWVGLRTGMDDLEKNFIPLP